MKENEVYESWKQEKRQIDVSQNFTVRVMNRVYQYEQSKEKSLFTMEKLIELISLNPLAKTGLVVIGAVTGIVRIIFMIQAILSNGVING
jgi:outer membrane protein assembly factor BamD (BamD/ComL family)